MARSSTTRVKGDGKGQNGGGRKKGTPNKVTGKIREALSPVIEAYLNGEGLGAAKVNFVDDLVKMGAEDRVKAIAALVPYVVPKLTSVELKTKEAEKTFRDELEELSNSIEH